MMLSAEASAEELHGWVQGVVLSTILRAMRRVDLVGIEKEDIARTGGFTPSGRPDLGRPPFESHYRVRAMKVGIKTACRCVSTQEVSLLLGKAHRFNLRHRKRPARVTLHNKLSRFRAQ